MQFIYITGTSGLDEIKLLFAEYFELFKEHLGLQDFEKELKQLPGLILALKDNKPAGCVGLKKFSNDCCEMGRLYVRSEYRQSGLGKELIKLFIVEAKRKGYKKILLDTVPSFKSAIKLYLLLGFKFIEPYYNSPLKEPLFMELVIK